MPKSDDRVSRRGFLKGVGGAMAAAGMSGAPLSQTDIGAVAYALAHDRRPAVDIYEALAYTAPGIVAHQSALQGGKKLKIPDFGPAEA
ncbi:MAG: twin-arginine translocation signal domain-containing protein [Armatimonadota bacterium]